MITRAMADDPTARFALAGEVGRAALKPHAALEATGRRTPTREREQRWALRIRSLSDR